MDIILYLIIALLENQKWCFFDFNLFFSCEISLFQPSTAKSEVSQFSELF